MTRHALVTGAAGFIGSNLCRKLLQEGWKVTGVDDLSSGHLELVQGLKGLTLVVNDFASKPIVESVESGDFDVVFHVAAVPRVSYSVENPSDTTLNNVAKTVKLMESCRGKIDRFVFSSSSSVYGGADVLPTQESYPKDPKSPYAWQKSAIEDAARLFGSLYNLDIVCLRYFNVFGRRQDPNGPYAAVIPKFIDKLLKHQSPVINGDGSYSRDFTHISKCIQANI